MLKTLIRKEVLNNLLNLRFALAYFLCALLMVGSAAIAVSDYLTDKKTYDISQGIEHRRQQSARDMYDFTWASKIFHRPPALTRIFALGGEKDADSRGAVAPEFSPLLTGDFKRNPIANLFPSVDQVFIIGVILSLLIFILTYDAISGERQEGTLKVLLCSPVPRDTILLAKWLGGLITLVLPVLTSALVIALMLLLNRQIAPSAGDWLRIVLIFGVCILYTAVVFSMALFVSVLFRQPSTGIMALLGVWIALMVALPAVATPLAYRVLNPPGTYQYEEAVARIGIIEWIENTRRLEAKVISIMGNNNWWEFGMDKWAELRPHTMPINLRHIGHIADSISTEGERCLRQEQSVDRLAATIARLSPYGCLQNACVALAGTGLDRELQLQHALTDYNRRAGVFMYDHYERGGDLGTYEAGIVPQFVYPRTSMGSEIARSLPDIAVLCFMCVFFFMAAYLAFLRMDAT